MCMFGSEGALDLLTHRLFCGSGLHLQPSEQVYECLGGPCSDLPALPLGFSPVQVRNAAKDDQVQQGAWRHAVHR